MANKKCEKCGADLENDKDKLCKTCTLKLMYGVSNKRKFRKRK